MWLVPRGRWETGRRETAGVLQVRMEPVHVQGGPGRRNPLGFPRLSPVSEDKGQCVKARGGVGGSPVAAVLSLQKLLSGGLPLPGLLPFQVCLG